MSLPLKQAPLSPKLQSTTRLTTQKFHRVQLNTPPQHAISTPHYAPASLAASQVLEVLALTRTMTAAWLLCVVVVLLLLHLLSRPC